jgi:hypothetical protein
MRGRYDHQGEPARDHGFECDELVCKRVFGMQNMEIMQQRRQEFGLVMADGDATTSVGGGDDGPEKMVFASTGCLI